MRNIILLIITPFLFFCGDPKPKAPTIDGSSITAFETSRNVIIMSLEPAERTPFDQACIKFINEHFDMEKAKTEGVWSHLERAGKELDGLTGKEVIAKAKKEGLI